MKFKKGDWVRDKRTKKVYQVAGTSRAGINLVTVRSVCGLLSSIDGDGQRSYDYSENNFKKWKPKYGEWCWFLNDCGIGVLSKFYDKEHDGFTESLEYKNYKYCEPFLGKLPSTVKKKN